MKCKKILFTIILILLQLCGSTLWARPTTANEAEKAVTGWLKADAQPLNATLGLQVVSVETFTNDIGEPIYYIVYLQPSGFVIVPADDSVEPIVGFVEEGIYDPSPDNPLGALVTNDLNGRIAVVRNAQKPQATNAMEAALDSQAKWNQLVGFSEEIGASTTTGLPSVSDPRVDPLVQSKWGQTTCCAPQGDPCALACYNYYTPQWDSMMSMVVWNPGDPNNYPCGCLATAMAQLMRFHQHPAAGIGIQGPFSIYVDDNWTQAWTRGGNGAGGPYSWNLMVYDPNCSTTVTQRQAIGALCYDAGVSVSMSYSAGGSSAWGPGAASAMRDPNIFDYSNAVTSNLGPNIPVLINMVNPNLDYNHPVILIVSDNPYDEMGHAVLADGYGYNLLTLYHHINMGWEGQYDAWYNLPNVYDYNEVSCCIYNVFVSGAGEIISGRVTDTLGAPISGAAVTAQGPGGPYITTTNSRGIYALAHLQSASTYTISVVTAGYTFTPQTVNTGTSSDWSAASGNVWGVNFTPQQSAIVYVDVNAPGNDDGSSWQNAYNHLQNALADPNASVIWVADGTYHPDSNSANPGGSGSRNASFVLKSGMRIYGGYPGYGTQDPNDRDIELYETILSGDLLSNDRYVSDPCALINDPCRAENSYNVVTGSNTDATVVLDGFTITAGNANGTTWPDYEGAGMLNSNANCKVNKCTFVENATGSSSGGEGGAMWNGGGNLQISNCIFYRNAGKWGGGGIVNYLSSPTLVNCSFISNKGFGIPSNGGALYNISLCNPMVTNCLFRNNSANYGGAISNIHASCPTITNCTFSGNLAGTSDGAINDYNNVFPIINNCIFWGNTAPQIGDGPNSAATVNYSDVDGGWSGAGIGNINADPCFMDPNGTDGVIGTKDDNMRLLMNSPCIDMGNNMAVPADTADLDIDGIVTEQTPLDLDEHHRFEDGDGNGTYIVDMGAYEFACIYMGDLDGDCDIDFRDFAILAAHWLMGK